MAPYWIVKALGSSFQVAFLFFIFIASSRGEEEKKVWTLSPFLKMFPCLPPVRFAFPGRENMLWQEGSVSSAECCILQAVDLGTERTNTSHLKIEKALST